MFAIIEVGNQQFKVAEGDFIDANRLSDEAGKDIILDKVLLVNNGKDIRQGSPYLKDVKVSAKVVEHLADDKKVAFKYRLRKNSSTKKG
ncbi:MAG: 50S ribosomal protein L21, partial [Candidatus Omnitrophica bacterium]|nr:50S ribosomal protein L21 [Candidatus Omnitrophota bacterium]